MKIDRVLSLEWIVSLQTVRARELWRMSWKLGTTNRVATH